jgi:apolipoprotein N-acyltransferase
VGRLAPRRAALAGWLFGLGWLVSSLWWLYISMHDFGGLAPPLAGAAVLLLAAFLSLYLAAAMAAVARWRTGQPASDALLYTGAWLLAELARASWFTGFPGRRRAMPTPTACWRRWRPGWASMA